MKILKLNNESALYINKYTVNISAYTPSGAVPYYSCGTYVVNTRKQILTPNSTTIASTMLPITVTKSKVFHGSLKKF